MDKPKIIVSSLTSLIDSRIDIRVVGLLPRQIVTLMASRITVGKQEVYLESYAKFLADNFGVVDLNTQQPIEGSYSCIDGMGLFWSMDVAKVQSTKNNSSSLVGEVLKPQKISITLQLEDTILDEITLTRQWKTNQITRYPVRENGIVATFFSNDDKKTRPGIIIVGGSEGGLNEYPAALLASHGFSVLSLAYFGIEHLPDRLVEIPLEYVKTSIDWLRKRPEVNDTWLGIHGTSKGSELALLSACYFSEINAVVSLNGSAVALSGNVPWSDEETLPPSWTFNGEAIPYASPINPKKIAFECKEMWEKRVGNPFLKWYDAITSDKDIVEKATIPVEKINGPILLISGEEDTIIKLSLSQKAIERLKNYESKYPYEHLIYPGAGHSIGIPYLRANTYNQGTKKDNATASVDSWSKTIEFFKNSSCIKCN